MASIYQSFSIQKVSTKGTLTLKKPINSNPTVLLKKPFKVKDLQVYCDSVKASKIIEMPKWHDNSVNCYKRNCFHLF